MVLSRPTGLLSGGAGSMRWVDKEQFLDLRYSGLPTVPTCLGPDPGSFVFDAAAIQSRRFSGNSSRLSWKWAETLLVWTVDMAGTSLLGSTL